MKQNGFKEWFSGIWNWLRDDWVWKVISVLVASLVFFSVRETVSHTYSFQVPVVVPPEFQGNLAAASIEPATVNVTFRGTASDIQRIQLSPEKPVVYIQPTTMKEEMQSVKLYSRNVRYSGSLRVDSIEPSTVNVQMDQQANIELPVAVPTVKGRPLRGTVHVEYTPKTAWVRGAQRSLERMKEEGFMLSTEPIDVDGRVQSFKKSARVLFPDGLRRWEINPAEILVDVNIIQQESERIVENAWVRVVQSQREDVRYRPEPLFVKVRLAGRSDILDTLDLAEVRVFAEETERLVTGAASITNSVPLRVMIPATNIVESVTVEPPSVLLVPVAKE